MVNHPNRGWRSRWTVQGCEAKHGPSGLVVRFQREACGGMIAEAGAWYGRATNAQEVFQSLRTAGTQDIERVLSRLMREAGDIFSEKNNE